MTREEAQELLPVIQAYAEGKTVECKCKGSRFDSWVEANCPSWSVNIKYRIKPEPKYRPFNTKEECWEEMHKHPDFGWVQVNVTCEYEQIVRIFDYCKTELSFNIANSDDDYTSEMMLNSYTFTDGTPFGVKEK